MKQLLAKLSRPALVTVLVLMLALAGSLTSASAIVGISEAFYVTDEAGVLTEETIDYIIQQNGLLEADCNGAQIAVVVVDFLDGMDIEDYCYQLFDEMNLGSDSEDNGVLLLLTIGEENYWCMQGTGLINSLSSGTIDDILWYNLEPDFAVGNYDAGVRTVFDALYNELCSIYGVSSSGSDYDGTDAIEDVTLTMTDWIIFIVFCLILMAVVLFVFTMIKKAIRKAVSGPEYTTYSQPLHPRRRSRPIIYVAPRPRRKTFGRPPYHGGPGMPPPGGRPTGRPTSRPTSSSRPSVRPSSSRPSSRPSRPTSSFGGGGRTSRPSGRGGGGMSRGGGAGRRGR